LIWIFKKSG